MPALPVFRVPALPGVVPGVVQGIVAGLLLAQPAQARPFPPEALRGELVITAPPEVLLNQKPQRLAPGTRIRDGANRVVLSGSLVGQKLPVHYTRWPDGQLRDVWLLTAAEAARQPWPRTPAEAAAWRFDPPSQTWTRP